MPINISIIYTLVIINVRRSRDCIFYLMMSSRWCGVRAYSLSHCFTQFSSYLLSDSEVVYSQVGPVWPPV